MDLSDTCLGDERHQKAMKEPTVDILPNLNSLVERADAVFALLDIPKFTLYTPWSALLLFLTHIALFAQVFSSHIKDRVAALCTTEVTTYLLR
ncbi:MAG: hypothetical protein OXC62_02775 [Aestuariivita sp.]|nr:hypothetical protein [Aestuariivita sp.]